MAYNKDVIYFAVSTLQYFSCGLCPPLLPIMLFIRVEIFLKRIAVHFLQRLISGETPKGGSASALLLCFVWVQFLLSQFYHSFAMLRWDAPAYILIIHCHTNLASVQVQSSNCGWDFFVWYLFNKQLCMKNKLQSVGLCVLYIYTVYCILCPAQSHRNHFNWQNVFKYLDTLFMPREILKKCVSSLSFISSFRSRCVAIYGSFGDILIVKSSFNK